MDDPELKWEIQESSAGDSENGKLSWLMRLGRKISVTGIVISSAPLVFPPIMARLFGPLWSLISKLCLH